MYPSQVGEGTSRIRWLWVLWYLGSTSTHCHVFFQIVGSRLRIPQVTPADSGEYVCHVSNGVGSQETSLIVTIESRGPSHGENVT